MKRKLLLFIWLGLFCSAYAQSPILTRNSYVNPGAVWKMADASWLSLDAIDVSITGENVTWDFRGLRNANTNTIHMYYKESAGTEFELDFPDANFVTLEEDYNTSNVLIFSKYSYWKITDSKVEKVGYKYLNQPLVSYSNYQTELVFPMQYGTTANDTWDNSASSYGGTIDFECVGYGTLMLPDATFHNVFMVYYEILEGISTNRAYMWYAENGALLLQYNQGFFSSALYALQEVNSGTTGIEQPQVAESIYYNNPVKNVLNVTIKMNNNSLLNFTLTNISGNIVMKNNAAASLGVNTFDFDVSNFPIGIYFLTINSTNNNKPIVLKVVKN